MTAKITALSANVGSLGTNKGEAFRFGDDNSGQLAGFRNKIINGDMRISQRGTGFTAVVNQVTYTLDRWGVYVVGASLAGQRFGSGGDCSLQIDGAAGNTAVKVFQRIEAANSFVLSGRSLTFSFTITSPNAKNITVELVTPNTSDAFGVASTLIGSNVVAIPSGASTVRTTFTMPQNVTNGIEAIIDFGAHTSGSLYISGVQLEEGSIATPFEQRPIGLELSLCQRYYESTTDGIVSRVRLVAPGAVPMHIQTVQVYFATTKRANPTVNTSSLTGTGLSIDNAGYRGFSGVAIPDSNGVVSFLWTASAEL